MIITLERPAKCADCGSELKAGQKARWYPNTIYGIGCHQNLSDGWKTYMEIARKFKWQVLPEDRDDIESDIIIKLKELKEKYGIRPLTVGGMMLAAKFVVADYWRRKGRESQRFTSLNIVMEHEGKPTELGDTIPDDGAIDLDEWLDTTNRLKACPPGVKRIACKLKKGDPLTPGEKASLHRFREDARANPNNVWLLYKRYHQRRALGLCVKCGEKTEDGFARCPRCREWARMRQAEYKKRKGLAWQAKLRKHWRRQGRCPRCGNPPKPGRKKCPHCLTVDGEYLRRWKKMQKAKSEIITYGEVDLTE